VNIVGDLHVFRVFFLSFVCQCDVETGVTLFRVA